MSRTDELRHGGGRERGGGGGGGTPFVKWGDAYTWIEGKITGTFTTKYGLTATFAVTGVHENGVTAAGRDEEGEKFSVNVEAGMEVNVGLSSAALQDLIEEGDVGKSFHVAFEGWEEGKASGNRYRVFAVIELTDRDDAGDDGTTEDTGSDDGLPF